MVAAVELVKVVQEGWVVGLLQMGLWSGTLEYLKRVREGSGEERRPEINKETMSCCEKETQPTYVC